MSENRIVDKSRGCISWMHTKNQAVSVNPAKQGLNPPYSEESTLPPVLVYQDTTLWILSKCHF